MKRNMTWIPKDIPDQSGKIVIVTGANSGIGYEASKELALKGAKVIMACRNLEKAKSAADKINKLNPRGQVLLKHLDLANLNSVDQFSQDFYAEFDRLDILLNNAGVMATPYQKTADGFELQFGTNHLGHFKLTSLLFDLLSRTPNSRVVTVTSYAHLFGWINFRDLNSERFYQRWLAYCQSKLANVMFAYELQRRSERNGRNPISVLVHPGYAQTNLQKTSGFFSWLNPYVAQSQEMGALPMLYAATSPEIHGGEYIGPDGFLNQRGYPHVARPTRGSKDDTTSLRLWEVSEKLTNTQFDLE